MTFIKLNDLLTKDQSEKISDILQTAMEENCIYPNLWELDINAIIHTTYKK